MRNSATRLSEIKIEGCGNTAFGTRFIHKASEAVRRPWSETEINEREAQQGAAGGDMRVIRADTRRIRTRRPREDTTRRGPARSGHFGQAGGHVLLTRLWLRNPPPEWSAHSRALELCVSASPFLPPVSTLLVFLQNNTLLMPDVFVKSFTHLKDRPKADQALRLLQRVASLTKPIMRKHGWVLPTLSEFFPEDPHLLGEYYVHLSM